MNSQTLILERITQDIESGHNMKVLNDRTFANTGTLTTVNADSYAHIASCTYSFQEGYVIFGPSHDSVASLWYGKSNAGKRPWVASDIPDLISRVVRYLTKEE